MVSTISIILVLAFIAAEYIYAVYKKQSGIFQYSNLISNLSVGIAERLTYLFVASLFYCIFKYIYLHFAVMHIQRNWMTWILLLLMTDFIWYWYHRLGHEVNFFWAAHIVHHQSEDFNLSVAARITIFQAFVRSIFWCILPFMGFHPDMILGILLFHGGYSFLTHTQMVGKLGLLEHILITPSHHRVHHAANEKYLDKNYGDVFVFWDKLFGTFQKEEEAPIYGLTHPMKSHSFLWQHFHYYAEIYMLARTKKSWREKFKVILGPPAEMDPNIRPVLERILLKRKKTPVTPGFKRYIDIQIIISLILLCGLTYGFNNISIIGKLEVFTFILSTLIICGAVLEQKKWVFYLEIARLWQLLAFTCTYFHYPASFLLLSALLVVLVSFFPVRHWYYSTIYQNSHD